jgi:hypothetical protein
MPKTLKTASYKNTGKDYIHKIQMARLFQTLHKQESPFFQCTGYSLCDMVIVVLVILFPLAFSCVMEAGQLKLKLGRRSRGQRQMEAIL